MQTTQIKDENIEGSLNSKSKYQIFRFAKIISQSQSKLNKNCPRAAQGYQIQVQQSRELLIEFRQINNYGLKNRYEQLCIKKRKTERKAIKVSVSSFDQNKLNRTIKYAVQIFQVQNKTLLREIEQLKQNINKQSISKIDMKLQLIQKDAVIQELNENTLISQLKEAIRKQQEQTIGLKNEMKYVKDQIQDLNEVLHLKERKITWLAEMKNQFEQETQSYFHPTKIIQTENIDMRAKIGQMQFIRKEIQTLRNRMMGSDIQLGQQGENQIKRQGYKKKRCISIRVKQLSLIQYIDIIIKFGQSLSKTGQTKYTNIRNICGGRSCISKFEKQLQSAFLVQTYLKINNI